MGGLTFTISATEELLERLDASADKAGLSRSAYILSWLPEYHEQDSQTGQHNATKGSRKAPTRGERLARTRKAPTRGERLARTQ